jgi:hypothetical protein
VDDHPAIRYGTTIDVLKEAITHERSWNRTIALTLLGLTGDPAHAGLYIGHLERYQRPRGERGGHRLGEVQEPVGL